MVGSHDNQDDGDFNALEPFFLQPYYFKSLSTVHTPVNFQKASKRIIFLDDVAYFVPFFFLTVCMPTTLFGQNLLKASAQSFQKIMHNHMQIYYCTVHWMQNT